MEPLVTAERLSKAIRTGQNSDERGWEGGAKAQRRERSEFPARLVAPVSEREIDSASLPSREQWLGQRHCGLSPLRRPAPATTPLPARVPAGVPGLTSKHGRTGSKAEGLGRKDTR